jgi:hypothetical protein
LRSIGQLCLTGRPPLEVRNNAVVLAPLDDFPAGTDVKIKATERFIPSVGRIEFLNYSMAWGGTGWVVAPISARAFCGCTAAAARAGAAGCRRPRATSSPTR